MGDWEDRWYVGGWEGSSSTLGEGLGDSAPTLLCGVRGVRGVEGNSEVASGGRLNCPVTEKG